MLNYSVPMYILIIDCCHSNSSEFMYTFNIFVNGIQASGPFNISGA